ncbi:TrkA family potassium uptake protein [bacterium]|nr:TrkA family potassium uptake protein [bacterium]
MKKAIIVGCGRVGSVVAQALAEKGWSVAIIDRDPDAFRRLPEDFPGRKIIGIAIDVEALKAAGIEEADVFLALTNGDNTNAMVAQMARDIFKVPRILARINDPLRAETYHSLGIPTVCQTTILSNIILEKILTEGE